MRDDDLDFPEDDDFDPLLDDFEDDLEDEAGAAPPPAPMSRQEMDAVVDQVLAEELGRLKTGRKTEN